VPGAADFTLPGDVRQRPIAADLLAGRGQHAVRKREWELTRAAAPRVSPA
jgi:hypothetical protein